MQSLNVGDRVYVHSPLSNYQGIIVGKSPHPSFDWIVDSNGYHYFAKSCDCKMIPMIEVQP